MWLRHMLIGVVGWSLLIVQARAQGDGADPRVRLNTVGFLPAQQKRASIAAECGEFLIVRTSDGERVLTGRAKGPVENADTAERLWVADFSELIDAGEYRLEVGRIGRSAQFRVGGTVYNDAFRTTCRAMYLWRCGTVVRGRHAGKWFGHEACHLDDGLLNYVGGGHTRKPATGGWHDAGDYNKYVVNAGVTVGAMLRAWEDFSPRIGKMKLGIPESGGATPDFLAEVRWEVEWLLKMQAEDGSVYHKLSTLKFGGMALPEEEKAERYFSPWSSAATASFVAMAATAARHLRAHDAPFAERCLTAARNSYAFLVAHPRERRADLRGFETGTYQSGDADDRLWAAAELWEATGDAEVLRDLEMRIGAVAGRVDRDFDWGNVNNLGMFTYVLSTRGGRDEALLKQVRVNLLAAADGIVKTAAGHGYARPLGTRYYWGCNGGVARQTMVLHVANRVEPNAAYTQAALDALGHLFGRNVYGRSFVTGLGHRPPMRPHDRRSAGDDVDEPWPGYLVGGPHPGAADWKDEQDDYRTNEIAINWNGALIYALAAFVEPQ